MVSRVYGLAADALPSSGSLGRTAGAFIVLYALARLVAFGRESTIAYTFGAGRRTDAYVAATTVPELVAGILLSGVIGYAIIPDYVRRRSSGDDAGATRFLQGAMWHVLVATGALAIALIVLAGPVISLVAPGLHGHARSDAILLQRIASPAIVLYGFTGLAGAVLNSRQSFLPVPISFLIGNLVGIGVLVAVSPAGIVAAAVAYLVSAAVFAAAQWWPAARVSSLPLLRPVWRGAEVSALVRAALPAVLIASALYLRAFVERVLASTASAGDLAALGFATRLLLVVGSLLAVSVGTVSFPTMAEQAIAEQRRRLAGTIRRALVLVGALSLPFVIAFLVAPTFIVRLLFQHGEFTAGNTEVTSSILQAYAIGLVAICLNEILVRALFALGAQRRALLVVVLSLAVNVALDLWLLDATGIEGLGIGASIALWLNAGLLALVLVKAIREPPRRPLEAVTSG
jgi:putative peptidoglycan lipid II flippase